MDKIDYVELIFSYTPDDFFEEPINLKLAEYDLQMDSGQVTATLDGKLYENNPGIKDQIHNKVKICFFIKL